MMLLPQASYTEVMTVLAGDLVLVPWAQDWRVPSPRVLSAWRTSTGPGPLEYLRDKVLTAALTEHGEHDWRAVRVGDLHLRSADGTLTRVPDTPANRAAFGSSGTADDSAPYPQVRGLALNDVSTRSLFAMPYGASGGSKPDAEQKLLDKAMDEYPYLFTMDALWLFDRNFPGAPRVARLIKKTHVLIRVKSDIPLKRVAFLLDRSWLADLAGGEGKDRVTVRVRVIEYWVTVEGQDVPEMFCLITDLLDCEAYPARVLAAAYRWRWDGSETGLRETKSLLDGPARQVGHRLQAQPDLEQVMGHTIEQIPGEMRLVGHRAPDQIQEIIPPPSLGSIADHREDEAFRGGRHRAQADLDREGGSVLGGRPRRQNRQGRVSPVQGPLFRRNSTSPVLPSGQPGELG
jgi:hypothetical protein